MWDGPRQGPRGGPPFQGDRRGDMFGGRDGPMPDCRGRDGMNMGPMGLRNQDRHMDMRRMDAPPAMRGRDMEPFDMRGREPNRDFCRPGNEPDFSLRRQYEIAIRDKLMNASGFMGQGRNSSDMGGRGMPNDRFMDMRDREMFRNDMPGFSNNNMESRRGFPMDPMGRNEGFRDMRDRPPMGMVNMDGFNMDMPPRDRGMMDLDRRGGPPFNARGGFKSDMDFRNRAGPSAEMMGRDRSPMRFGENDGAPMDVRGRPDMAPDLGGPNRSKFTDKEGSHKDRAFPDSRATPPLDFRGGEEMTLAEEWKSRRVQEKNTSTGAKGMGDSLEQRLPPGLGREGKDLGAFGFPRSDRFAELNLPPIGQKGLLDPPFPIMGPLPGSLNRELDSKRWSGDRDLKQNPNTVSRDDVPPFNQEKNQLTREVQGPRDVGAQKEKIGTGPEFQSSSGEQRRDQDYRDIDYRTGSGRVFDYKHEELHGTANVLKETKEAPPSKFSGSQDQDYRSASVKDKVSHTISIIGIPKTATMEQILGAFAVRDGVPMQGMKIKSVVPGYSYDTAYVEFLNLEDAVHFMESNKGSLKVGTKIASMRYIQPMKSEKEAPEPGRKGPLAQEPLLPSPCKPPEKPKSSQNGSQPKPEEPLGQQGQRQRSSDLTPEAWQQQVDQRLRLQETEQQAEAWANRNPPRHGAPHSDPIFKESKTMIIKNVKPTTTVETILKALDPFAYLDERNVRLVRGKPPGAKCFCFVDMDSHEQVTRLVELLTKPRPLSIDGVRVYAEVAKPLKNQNFRKEFDKPNSSLLGYPTDAHMLEQQQYYQGLQPPMDSAAAAMQGDPMAGSVASSMNPALMHGAHMDSSSYSQGMGYGEAPPMDPSFQALGSQGSEGAPGMAATGDGSEAYIYGSETPDMSSYLFDATSGFYYDPQTTLYYDPGSRYFYNAQTQGYLYWDSLTKSYIPVPGGSSVETPAVGMALDMQAILSNPAADAPLELKKPSDPKAPDPPPPALVTSGTGGALAPVPGPTAVPPALHSPVQDAALCPLSAAERREDDDAAKKDKEDKPRSLAAFKIMKDMERWAKIQNRQKETVRAPSPVLKIGAPDDRKSSKAADAAFAIFKGGDDLFKKPLAPPKNDEKPSKRPMGSLGLLASDYAATGSDEEVEEERQPQSHDPPRAAKSQAEDKEDKLTDWKKMACLLCRRQFPNKDALVRHQQLSDLHKQNMEIHLKIKRSKKELEALENQEKELGLKEPAPSPEPKRRKHQHHHHQQQQQHHGSWAGGSRDSHKMSERPGLGSEPVERKKKEPVVWDHATYKQAVRKAMFARFKELD